MKTILIDDKLMESYFYVTRTEILYRIYVYTRRKKEKEREREREREREKERESVKNLG